MFLVTKLIFLNLLNRGVVIKEVVDLPARWIPSVYRSARKQRHQRSRRPVADVLCEDEHSFPYLGGTTELRWKEVRAQYGRLVRQRIAFLAQGTHERAPGIAMSRPSDVAHVLEHNK